MPVYPEPPVQPANAAIPNVTSRQRLVHMRIDPAEGLGVQIHSENLCY
jgi:hypothetical protein